MNKRQLLILIILLIFGVGMTMGSVTASHTYHKGKYSFSVSDSQYDKIQYVKKHKHDENLAKSPDFKVKTKKKYTVKKPVYKKKKVTKYKWKYIKVLSFKSVSTSDWSDTTYYEYDTSKYSNNGWTLYGWQDKESSDGHIYYSYAKFKKKVKVTETKKVKKGYKKVKMPIYAVVTTYAGGHWNEDTDTFVPTYYPQVQFIAMKKGYSNEYLTPHYTL